MSARPATAPPGRPPARILASVVRSGRTPKCSCAARRHAEAGDDLVEDQQAILAGRNVPKGVQERPADGHGPPVAAGRLQDDAADVRVGLERALHGVGVVGRQHDGQGGDFRRDSRRRGAVVGRVGGGDEEVVPAVEVAGELEHLGPAGEDPRQPQGHQRRLGARRREAHRLRRRHEPLDELAPFDLFFVAGAGVRGLRHLPLHRLDHGGMAVAEKQRPVAGPVIDEFLALDGPLAAAGGAVHVDGERLRDNGRRG